MRTELTDVSETQKTLSIEIPSEIVDAEINRLARDYGKQARVPGFRPGKVPASVIKQRYRDQIMHDVLHGLIPRAIEDALQERGIEPIDTPDVKDVALREGQPLTFTAAIETVPAFDPGELSTITVSNAPVTITDEAIDQTLQRLRERAAKFEPVEARPVADQDTVVLDLERTDPDGKSERHENVTLEIGSTANPPGFDAQLIGLGPGESKTFVTHFPEDYPVSEMANTDVTYAVTVKELRRRVLPELDDEFAKDLGEFDSLSALRDRVRTDMQAEAEEQAKRQTRNELLKHLAERVTFELPASLVDREIDRRLQEFVRQLMDQNIDPRQAGIDWAEFREAQREPARLAVASALVLDELAKREEITVTQEELDKELEDFATRSGRTALAVRAQIEKEGGLGRLAAGLRREKTVAFALSRVTTQGGPI